MYASIKADGTGVHLGLGWVSVLLASFWTNFLGPHTPGGGIGDSRARRETAFFLGSSGVAYAG